MECPKCHDGQSKVVDSRPADNGASIRRRRECLNCGFRFNTYERVERVPLLVVKKDGTREEFMREKLLRGVVRACEKRPVSREQLELLVNKVENLMRESMLQEVPSDQIGEFVMPLLLDIDEVSYIRFASVYREFKSRESFINELEKLRLKDDSSEK